MLVIPFVVGLAILIFILKILEMPMKIIIKFIINAVLGIVVIYGLNYFFSVGMVLNWFSALLVGILGIPGVVVVAILQFALHLI